MEKKEKQQYFEEALSDFTHDVASGRAIRHLVDLGYTTEQICRELAYPTPKGRVEQTVLRYLKEKGIIIDRLPEIDWKEEILRNPSTAGLQKKLRNLVEENGQENSFVICPFGMIYRDREVRMNRMMRNLTSREKEYLLGIPWERCLMYHQLNDRMMEIGSCLAMDTPESFCFYFLQTGVTVRITGNSN